MNLKLFKPIRKSPIQLQKVNLIVGPNNSGKSQLLNDIKSQIIDTNSRTVIIEKLDINDFSFPKTYADATSDLKIRDHHEQMGIKKIFFYDFAPRGLNNFEKSKTDLENCEKSYDGKNFGLFFDYFKRTRVLLLDSASRLTIANSLVPHDPRTTDPLPLLQAIAQENDILTELQSIFQDAFGMAIRLDYYTPGLVSFRVGSKQKLKNSSLPKSLLS